MTDKPEHRPAILYSILFLCLFCSVSVQAEYLGLINGRTANIADTAEVSAEFGLVTGDLDRFDYQNIAARVNYRLNAQTALIGTIGISEFDEADGTPFGIGLMYHLHRQRISNRVDIATKASYHTGGYEVLGVDGDLSSLSLEVLVSGQQPISQDLNWYANAGYHRISVDFNGSDSTNELGLGGGLVFSTGLGEAYVGIDFIDEMVFGIGFRYSVQ